MVHAECRGKSLSLHPEFGVLTSPGWPERGANLAPWDCQWFLQQGRKTRQVDLTLHFVDRRNAVGPCEDDFLKVSHSTLSYCILP